MKSLTRHPQASQCSESASAAEPRIHGRLRYHIRLRGSCRGGRVRRRPSLARYLHHFPLVSLLLGAELVIISSWNTRKTVSEWYQEWEMASYLRIRKWYPSRLVLMVCPTVWSS